MDIPASIESLTLPVDKVLEARMEAASHYPDVKESGLSRVWIPYPGLQVKVDAQKEWDNTVHDKVYSVTYDIDPANTEAGAIKIVASPDGMLVMQPGGEGQEVVTDPQRRLALIGGIATKLQTAMEAAQPQPEQPAKIISLLGRLVGRSETELADAA